MAILKEEPLKKWVFSLPAVIYLAENLFGPKILVLSFFCWSGIILFSSDLFLFTFFRSLIGNPSFPFFSFLPFLSFHFSLSISFFENSGFSIRYLLSLEEILLSFSSGERMRILFIGQGSNKLKVVSQHGLFIVRARFWYLGQNKSVCQGVGLGLNFHIISTRHV